MDQPRVIGHVVSVSGFRLRVELAQEAKSSSRATPDGVQRAVAINSYLTFDLGAGTHAIGVLSDLDAKESYDPSSDEELTLQLTKPRRIASVQLLGTVRQQGKDNWKFDTGITVLPTLDTPAEVANPAILNCIFGQPPKHSRPLDFEGEDYDYALPIGHQTGDESTIVKASFNDLFSRPLAIVGNTGSGKSYTVASLLRSLIDSNDFKDSKVESPHVFIFDVNGEYASAFLSEEEQKLSPRQPNEAYVNGRKLALPLWLMNSEEICEWLSASEQTQQPVLKSWWAQIKSSSGAPIDTEFERFTEALALLQHLRPFDKLKKNDFRSIYLSVLAWLKGAGIDLTNLDACARPYLIRVGTDYKTFYNELVDNAPDIARMAEELKKALEGKLSALSDRPLEASGDAPGYVSLGAIRNTGSLTPAAASDEVGQLSQHLTTLRMRLKARLADRRWGVFLNYESEKIDGLKSWFEMLGFLKNQTRITVLDLSMLAHEVLPFVCAVIGRTLLEAREKLPSDERFKNPWVVVLEEAHNYARPARRENEEKGQALSRSAFERIAKEGRKFGLSLIVASQRPSEISPTIISQCANFFSHRLQNPDDIEHFRRIIPRQAQRLLDQVTVLASGEAIVFGSAVYVPARVQISMPRKEPSSRTSTPYSDWRKAVSFPLDTVISNWGISGKEKSQVPEVAAAKSSSSRPASKPSALKGAIPSQPQVKPAKPSQPVLPEPAKPDQGIGAPRGRARSESDDTPR